jgi:cell division protein ZapA
MKQLEVQIMGQSYLLTCPDGGEVPLLEAVERVDTAMCKIRDAGKVRARDRIAVLAALNLAFELSGRAAAVSEQTSAPSAGHAAPHDKHPSEPVHQADENQLLISLMERLDGALNEDGQLL